MKRTAKFGPRGRWLGAGEKSTNDHSSNEGAPIRHAEVGGNSCATPEHQRAAAILVSERHEKVTAPRSPLQHFSRALQCADIESKGGEKLAEPRGILAD